MIAASVLLVSSVLMSGVLGSSLAFAADGAQPLGTSPYDFIQGTVQFFLIAFFVYFFLVLRPQQIREDDQSRFLKELKKDDEVLTTGGLFGRVTSVGEGFVSVEIAQGVKVRVHPQHLTPALDKAVVQGVVSKNDSSKAKGPVKIK